MITNRDLTTDDLFAQALEEAVESARENGVAESDIVAILRACADDIAAEDGDTEADGTSDAGETDEADGTDGTDGVEGG